MSEPNDAQAVIAGVLREHTHSFDFDYCYYGHPVGGVPGWANHLAERVDAALGRLTRERAFRDCTCLSGVPARGCKGVIKGRWVGDWEAQQ